MPDNNNSTNNNNNETSTDTLLFGIWQNETAIWTEYDSLGNITTVDTVTFSNSVDDPVIYYEEYKSPSAFRMITELTDTLATYASHKNGMNFNIDVPDSNFFFNNRTITALNDSILSVFEIYSLNPQKMDSKV